jgi:hypothetical protein
MPDSPDAGPSPAASRHPGEEHGAGASQADRRHRWHTSIVIGLLGLGTALAANSLIRDSVTFDETSHLTAGLSVLKTGDFRLAPDHPPLGKLWCAWPLLLVDHRWPPDDCRAWQDATVFNVGRAFLFERNDGQRLVVIGRCMMVVLWLATVLATYAAARQISGRAAGLLALTLAVLCPTLLAHGRLVTTDVPITLAVLLTLLAFGRLARGITWRRMLAAGAALAAASVTKFSWPLVVPALLVMAIVVIMRRAPLPLRLRLPRVEDQQAADLTAHVAARWQRALLLAALGAGIALLVWLGVWTTYLWRGSIVAPLPPDAPPTAHAELARTQRLMELDWLAALRDYDGRPRTGPLAELLRFAAARELLPEAYLLGLAQTMATTGRRSAYLCGEYSLVGWRSYFPVAFALKTPVATQALILAGAAALVLRRTRPRDGVLLAGLLTFGALYAGYVVHGGLNIGLRHLLPALPALYVIGGAAAAWLTSRVGRWLIGAAVAWLLAANLWIHPHYLAYFNEPAGGPAQGHRFLADSNIDWGQDLLRLADYARRHPQEQLKLAYFGSAIPTRYVACAALPSYFAFEPPADLTAGTYVVSITQALGIYDEAARPAYWTAERRREYGRAAAEALAPPRPQATDVEWRAQVELRRAFADLRARRLLSRLAERPPDERIGWSLRVYRLSAEDIEELTRP